MKRLEQSVIRTSAAFGIQSCTTEHTGVWVGDNKLCAIGEICIMCNVYCVYSVLYIYACNVYVYCVYSVYMCVYSVHVYSVYMCV